MVSFCEFAIMEISEKSIEERKQTVFISENLSNIGCFHIAVKIFMKKHPQKYWTIQNKL